MMRAGSDKAFVYAASDKLLHEDCRHCISMRVNRDHMLSTDQETIRFGCSEKKCSKANWHVDPAKRQLLTFEEDKKAMNEIEKMQMEELMELRFQDLKAQQQRKEADEREKLLAAQLKKQAQSAKEAQKAIDSLRDSMNALKKAAKTTWLDYDQRSDKENQVEMMRILHLMQKAAKDDAAIPPSPPKRNYDIPNNPNAGEW